VQYFDDTPAKDPAKALSVRTFDPGTACRKQQDHCAVCYSLQAFGTRRTKDQLLVYRNLGVDIDVVPAAHRARDRGEVARTHARRRGHHDHDQP